MADIQCPACGSNEVETSEVSRSYSAPFGGTKTYRVRVDSCRTCGESGDFAGANGAIVKAAIEEADRESVGTLLEWINKVGVSTAYLERALSLPARTVARWKAGGSSASGIALLRLVRTYPWLLEVADARFAEPVAKQALVSAAATVLGEAAANNGFQYSVAAGQPTKGAYEIRATFVRTSSTDQRMLGGAGSADVTENRAA